VSVEAVEEQKPATAAASAAVDASAPMEPSLAQSPGTEEVMSLGLCCTHS